MTKWSGRFLGLGIMSVLCLPTAAFAAEISVKSDTIFRGFERDTATESEAMVLPAYEYLQIDVDTPGEPGLALHLYGWGRGDLADKDYYDDTTDGEVLYGYLEYSKKEARFNAKLGRQHVFEGVANETLDGLRISSDLGRYFSGSLYGGQQVAMSDEQGRSGDSIYGGRLSHHLIGRYALGVSYKKITNDSEDAEEMTGVDLAAYLPYDVNLFGNSTYNFESEDWAEHSYEMRATFGQLAVRPYFQKFKYDDYFATGANSAGPFRFLADSGEELTVGGGDFTLSLDSTWVLVGKFKHYTYEVLDDASPYYGAQATWSGEKHCQIGGEVGYMNGEVAQNDYYLVRLFTYWDQLPAILPIGFVSADVVYVGYDKPIYEEDNSLFVSLGAGKKFMEDALELKLSGDYSSDPYFDQDVRGMLTASYRFGHSL
ncbi:MAG: hypothetical protein KKB30_09605 [Proteobacteria bacterium]|nr:hypothetical protein [Pseudomonadota bacterium]MBU1716975.1 hypothetical protein [Pseudomonadota bacterium]